MLELIDSLFFPDNLQSLDIGPSSSSPFAKELAQLFVHDETSENCHLSRADVREGFVTMATSYARRTLSIQAHGNAIFRHTLRIIFRISASAPDMEKTQFHQELVDDLCDEQNTMSPVSALDDENPPLLRSVTTTPATMIGSRGQELLEWDQDTEHLFDMIVADLFNCITPAAASVSQRELQRIAQSASEDSVNAERVLEKYQPLWTLAASDCLTRNSVRLIFAQLSTRILCRQRLFSLPVSAYIRRKLRPVVRAVEAMKTYEEGKEYAVVVRNSFGKAIGIRCRLLKRLDVQKFRVEYKGTLYDVTNLYEIPQSISDDNSDSDDFDDSPPKYAARPILKHPFAHLDWSDGAYASDMQFALRAIAADFPRFQLGEKLPKVQKSDYWVTFNKASGLRMDFERFDYGINFAPFCTPEMLPSLSADDHKRLMDTAAMRESFRCFFLHLAVELGVHPVALQVIAPHIIATCIPTFTHTPCPSLLFPYSTCVASDAQRCRN
jgi:hypothetical protein